MAFEKGHKLSKGRPKGSTNKSTTVVKDLINSVLEDNAGRVVTELKTLDGKDFFNVWLKLVEYQLPKLRSVDQRIDISKLSDEEVERLFGIVTKNLEDE